MQNHHTVFLKITKIKQEGVGTTIRLFANRFIIKSGSTQELMLSNWPIEANIYY